MPAWVRSGLGFAVLLALAAMAAAAQDATSTRAAVAPQDGPELLGLVANAHRELHSFETSGVLAARVEREGAAYEIHWPVSTAQADSTLLPADSVVPVLSPLIRFGQATVRDGVGAARTGFKLASPKGWSLFDQIDLHLTAARRLPDETVHFEGRPVTCRVVEAEYEAGFPSRALSGHPIRYWIEPQRLLVLKVSFGLRNAALDETVFWTFTADAVRANEPPPQWALQTLPQLAGHELAEWSGRPAPDFTLTNLEGREVRLADLRGKAVLLNFWATWCAPCAEELPLLEKLRAEWGPAGLEVWGVTNEPATRARSWLTGRGLDFPTLVDDGRQVFSAYEVDRIPVSVVLNRDGEVVSYWSGLGGESHFRSAIEAALAQ